MEDERLGLAEGVDHAVQEADEERGVEAHRAGGVEQHDEAQRLDLAPAPDELDRRSAMGDVAVDGAAQIEAPAAPPRPLAAHQPRPHARGPAARRARGSRRPRRDRRCGAGRPPQSFGARGAFAAAAAVGGARRRRRRCAARRDRAGRAPRCGDVRFGEPPRRRLACAAAAGKTCALAHAAAEPVGVENLVEALPVGVGGAEQRAQRRLAATIGRARRRRGEDGERVAAFRPARPRNRCRAACARSRRAGGGAELPSSARSRERPRIARVGLPLSRHARSHLDARAHHATLPSSRSLTSRVSRARSSCVLSRQIIVS